MFYMTNILDVDVIWMRYALIFSRFSNFSQDVSVGSVLVYRGYLIGYGWNSSVLLNDPSAHAEIITLRLGGRILGNYRLLETVLYVTLEPCIMCIGAMIHARISRLVCGAKDNKIGWIKHIFNHPKINHRVIVKRGILEETCAAQINNFFKKKRQ